MRALDAHGLPRPEGGGAALLRSSELARRRGTAAVDGGDHGHDATARERGRRGSRGPEAYYRDDGEVGEAGGGRARRNRAR